MGVTAGLDCKSYRNTGTYNSPTWTEMTSITDVDMPFEKGKAEVKARLSRYKMSTPTHKAAPVSFTVIRDTSLAEYDVLKAAWVADTVIDMAFANGAIATANNEYWRGDYQIYGFKPKEPLDEVATAAVELDLNYSTNVPAWTTAS